MPSSWASFFCRASSALPPSTSRAARYAFTSRETRTAPPTSAAMTAKSQTHDRRRRVRMRLLYDGGRLLLGLRLAVAAAAALAGGADVRGVDALDPLVRVGVLAGYQHDVAVVGDSAVLTLGELAAVPRQGRLRAHVVVHQATPVSGVGIVRQRAVQQVAVEEDDRARLDFDRHRLSLGVREVLSLLAAVEAPVVVMLQPVEDSRRGRARDDPEAAVLDGGVVHRDPGACQRAVAGGNVDLVLVPGLAGLARRFDEEHRLHALHVGADHVGQHLGDSRVAQVTLHERRNLVREVDAQVAPHRVVVRLARRAGEEAVDVASLALADGGRLVLELFDLLGAQAVLDDEKALLLVEAVRRFSHRQPEVAGGRLTVRPRRPRRQAARFGARVQALFGFEGHASIMRLTRSATLDS